MAADMEMVRLYQPPALEFPDGRSEDLLMTFLFFVAVPVVLVATLLVMLSFVMCCSRQTWCKCKKYSSLMVNTNDVQMDSYNTIRRASFSLRHMSQNRETPVMGSRADSMTLDRSYRNTRRNRDSWQSAPGTLQRQQRNRHSGLVDQQAPPPPAYNMHSSDPFYGSEFLSGRGDMQASVQYDDNPENNGSGAQPLLYRQRHQ